MHSLTIYYTPQLPIAMASRKIAAAIAAGCTSVVKPAGETPFATLTMCLLAQRAGIPDGVINCITALENTAVLGQALCTDPRVKKVSFTGSTAVGKLLVKQSADTLKKMSLELGGNAPFIVFDDADVDHVIPQLVATKMRNSGQTCTAANRIMVQKGILDRFLTALEKQLSSMPVGGGTDPKAQLGPLMSKRGVGKVDSHVKDALQQGAKINWQAGSDYLSSEFKDGHFYPPTILTGLNPKMKIWQEESFGPISAIAVFETEDEALAMANDSDVGLGAYMFTQDVGRAWRVGEKIQTGMVAINHGMLSASEGAFGGIKQSGYGKEGSLYGIDDYMIIKTLNFYVAPQK
jgi:succinate-semialdehyde dehydrogenase/glutarate-semialdehyde dehydrogenase